jgi:hypothetical protein
MRPLNRPMFRYGGPIKEGVMSGIREPRQNYQSGQLVRPGPGRPGYKGFSGVIGGYDTPYNVKNVKTNIDAATKAGKVKNLLNKSKSFFKKPLWSERGINYLFNRKMPQWAKGAARTIGGLARGFGSRMPRATTLGKWVAPYYGMWKASEVTPVDEKYGITRKENLLAPFYTGERAKENINKKFLRNMEQESNPNNFWRYNPGKYGPRKDHPDYDPKKVKWNPWSEDKGAADTPIRYDKDGNIIRFNDAVSHFGMKVLPATGSAEDITGTKEITETNPWKEKYEALVEENKVPKKSAEERRAEKLQRYRDIVDIKGMNREAAGKSLIEASRLINESQDFKAYDKPADMKRAIDTLILKSEIQHDLNKEEKKIANELNLARIEKLNKELNPSKSDLIGAYAKTLKGQSLYDTVAEKLATNKGEVFRGNLIKDSDFKKILSNLKKDPNTKDVDDDTIIKTWTQGELDSSQKNIPDGNYTVGSSIVTIKDKQVVAVN